MEEKILNLFAHNESLSFKEIQKSLKIRSNNLAYHLKKLIKDNKLEKSNKEYRLSPDSEYLIPYMSEKQAVIPVVLVLIKHKGRAFLVKRTKRPYLGLLGLPGGRLLVGESPEEAAKRIARKFNIKINNQKIEKIFLEHIKKKNKIIHSFILILVSAKAISKINLTDIQKNKPRIIKSDYFLIKSKSSSPLMPINSKE